MAVVMAAMLVFSGCGKDTAVSGQGNDTFQGDEVSQGNESTAAATQSAASAHPPPGNTPDALFLVPAPQPAAVKVAEAVATRDRNGDFAL